MSQHNTQGRQGQGARRRYNKGGRSYGNDRRDSSGYRPKYRKEAPAKLSLWQRFLGLFGIRPSKNNKYAARDKAAAKTNTRVARNRQDRVSAPKQPVSNRRLYVGNLSYEATESDLEDVFKGIGEVNSVEIIYNPRTHKSKGYAFVEMKKMEDAIRSVDILHNQPFMGRNLLVSGAERQEQPRQPREDRAPREQGSMAEVKETSTPCSSRKLPLPSPRNNNHFTRKPALKKGRLPALRERELQAANVQHGTGAAPSTSPSIRSVSTTPLVRPGRNRRACKGGF
ncbi:MAG: hypothetical protein ACLT8C_00590 [Akkermansia muciniphila]